MTSEGYGQAYRVGYDRTVRFLCSKGVTHDSAREVAQAAWARGWECIKQLRDEDVVLKWVNMIALNLFRAALRSTKEFEPLTEIRGTSAVNLAAIEMAQVLRIIGPGDRSLFQKYLQGLTTREIARDQGVSETAIRVRLWRARKVVTARLQRVA